MVKVWAPPALPAVRLQADVFTSLSQMGLIEKGSEAVLPCWLADPSLVLPLVCSISPPGFALAVPVLEMLFPQRSIPWFISSSNSELTCPSSWRAAVAPWREEVAKLYRTPGSILTTVTSAWN